MTTLNDKLSKLTEEELAFLNQERKKYLNGEGKSYSWDEVKNMIRKEKPIKYSTRRLY